MTKGPRTKSFATTKRTPDEKSDLSFDLGDEHYVCTNEIQGAVILDFVAAADQGGAAASAKILSFLKEAIIEADYPRFEKQLASKEEIIEMETLSEIVAYRIGEYTSRPTQESESSDDGS